MSGRLLAGIRVPDFTQPEDKMIDMRRNGVIR